MAQSAVKHLVLLVGALVSASTIAAATPSVAARALPGFSGPHIMHPMPGRVVVIKPPITVIGPSLNTPVRCRSRQTCAPLAAPVIPVQTIICYGPHPGPNACPAGEAPWCEGVRRGDGSYTGYGYWHCVTDHRTH